MASVCTECGCVEQFFQQDDYFIECYYCGGDVCVDCLKRVGTRLCCPDCAKVKEEVAPNSLYKPTRSELDEITADPIGWFERQKKLLKNHKDKDVIRYFLTFTRNPNSRYDKDKWLARVKKELSKAVIVEVYGACLEHEDTNVHCHAFVAMSKRISKADIFKVFIRDYGFVDCRFVKDDHGVQEYMSKMMPEGVEPVKDPEELRFSS